jgi:hypothetical protein
LEKVVSILSRFGGVADDFSRMSPPLLSLVAQDAVQIEFILPSQSPVSVGQGWRCRKSGGHSATSFDQKEVGGILTIGVESVHG